MKLVQRPAITVVGIEGHNLRVAGRFLGLARYFFLPVMEAAGLACVLEKGAAGTATFFGCLGFFCSRLLRF